MRYAYYFGVLALLAGCSTASGDRSLSPSAGAASSQQDLADQALDQREQAYKLRDMAERRAVEAEVQANERGSQDESVQQKRKLAKDLDAAADEAEQNSRDLRQQVPHGMVQ